MKPCTKCKQIKPLSDFPRDKRAKDGRTSQCNACKNTQIADYQATPAGQKARRETQRKYRESERGQTKRKAYGGSKVAKEQRRRYAQTDNGKIVMRKAREKYRRKILATKEGRLKRQSIMAVGHAVESGRMPPASSIICSCGKPAEHYHHDLGYAKPYWLHVQPVCKKCHTAIHHS